MQVQEYQVQKEKIIEWLNLISQRIYIIKTSQKIYDQFKLNEKEGKFKGLGSDFLWWVRNNYESNIVLLFTGLLEGSKRYDDLNFQRFLSELKKTDLNALKKDLLSQKFEFISDFNNPVSNSAEDDDPLEIMRKSQIEMAFEKLDIDKDIKFVNSKFKLLKDKRDKHIAHFTSYDEDINITHTDLYEIINEIIEIFDNYTFIIANRSVCFD